MEEDRTQNGRESEPDQNQKSRTFGGIQPQTIDAQRDQIVGVCRETATDILSVCC